MSELVLVFPVIALTGIVLVGILVTFRKYVIQRDKLMAADEASSARPAARQADRHVERPGARMAA